MSLLITGVIDGPLSGGFPKAIEFTATEDIADLSIYEVGIAFNGNDAITSRVSFPPVSLGAGETFYLSRDEEGFQSFFGFAPDALGGNVTNFNGDDVLQLFEGDTLIDSFGVLGTDGTGEPWEFLDGWAYRNDGAEASPVFNPSDWTFSGPNALDGETTNAQAETPFPFGTFDVDPGDPPTGSVYSISALNAVLPEGDVGSTIYTFLVSRSGDTDAMGSVDFAVSGADVEALDFGGTLPSGTVEFGAGDTEATIEIAVAGDDILEDDEDFTVTLSNPVGGTIGTGTAEGTIQTDDLEITLISEIQGNAATWITEFGRTDATPFFGETVTVRAVVVGDFQDGGSGENGDFNGFYLQEEDADTDGDATTSEGIFIFDGFNPNVDVQVGDVVEVTGTATEFFGETQIRADSVTVVESGVDLPTASVVEFPVAQTITNSDGQLIADLEAYEGMLVTVPQTLTVGDLFNYGRFGEIGLSANGRVNTFTQDNAPSVDGFNAYLDEQVRATVVIDDGSTVQNPEVLPYPDGSFGADDDLTSGDTLSGLTGVVRFSRGSGGSGDELYRINPTEDPVFENTNPREETPPDVGGRLQVATFNVLNFFTTLDDGTNTSGPGDLDPRGAEDQEEFDRQVAKLVDALAELDADVLGLIELENELIDMNGDGQVAIEVLVEALNQATGRNYTFADPGTEFVGDDAIMVGVLYDQDVVEIAEGTTVEVLTDDDLGGLGLDFGNPVFDGPGTSRAPIAVTFEELATGATFTVSVNHFKSKGSVSPFGNNEGIGDGTGNNNETRDQAAQALEVWLASDPTGGGTENVLILGDLNAYQMEDPVQELLDGADNQAGTSDDMVNLSDDYTFGFPADLGTAGQVQAFGSLDYAIASAELAGQVTGAATWHINADEPSTLDYNTNFRPDNPDLFAPDAFRSSDHDPIIIGLDLEIPEPEPETVVARLDFREGRFLDRVIYSVDGERVDRDFLPLFSDEIEVEAAGITFSTQSEGFDLQFLTTFGRGLGITSLFTDRGGERTRINDNEALVVELDEVDGLGDATGTGIEFQRIRGDGEIELSFYDEGELVETVTLEVEDGAVDYDLIDFASFDEVQISTTDDLEVSVSAIEFDRLIDADTMDFV